MADKCLKNWFYWTARFSLLCWMKIWLRFRSEGSMNVPSEGSCIIAANHVSYLDPPALGAGVSHRIVHFMARDTLYSTRVGNWFMRNSQCIPLDRTKGDVGALRKALAFLKEGKVLGLFPEGTRSLDGKMQPAKGGIGFLIAKAGVPVVPAFIYGTYKAFPRHSKWVKPGKMGIIYGKPIMPEEFAKLGNDRNSYDLIGQYVMKKIAELETTR
jgi:1-acyl-sn-glycerol-3-phosphate acyltransferase